METITRWRILVCLLTWLLAIAVTFVSTNNPVGLGLAGVIVALAGLLTIWEIRESTKEGQTDE